MHKSNEHLVKLRADRKACLLSHQGLSAILDLDDFQESKHFLSSLMDRTYLKNIAINNYP